MTVGTVGTAKVAGLHGRNTVRQHVVGDQLALKVVRKIGERSYQATFRDTRHVVESAVALEVGTTVRAVVTAVGQKLELRYLSSDPVSAAMQQHEAVSEDALAEFAARHGIELRQADRSTIEKAMHASRDPGAMTSAGVFLAKLNLPVVGNSMKALYAAQSWDEKLPSAAASASIQGAHLMQQGALDSLARLMARTLDPQESPDAPASAAQLPTGFGVQQAQMQLAAADADAGDADQQRDLAQRLLNEPDDGSVTYRYGVLPVLIDDQLVELDLVCFRDRNAQREETGVRRLVMSFKTTTLGRIEVLAQALGDRLSVGIRTESSISREALANGSHRVKELLARLGWNVESMSYEMATEPGRAAQHVVDHVLNADTLSRLV